MQENGFHGAERATLSHRSIRVRTNGVQADKDSSMCTHAPERSSGGAPGPTIKRPSTRFSNPPSP